MVAAGTPDTVADRLDIAAVSRPGFDHWHKSAVGTAIAAGRAVADTLAVAAAWFAAEQTAVVETQLAAGGSAAGGSAAGELAAVVQKRSSDGPDGYEYAQSRYDRLY